MPNLTKICIQLDSFHRELFKRYNKVLNLPYPKSGFLTDDCFIPCEEECYPVIADSWHSIADFFEALKKVASTEVHQHLRQLNYFHLLLEALKKPKITIQGFKEIQDTCKTVGKFLKRYDYKLRASYQANNAILLACLLIESAKSATKFNVPVDEPILQHAKSQKTFTLSQIANSIVKSTAKAERNLQFIALGVTASGEIWATTNYHTPVIYPLNCLMSDEKYQLAEKLRHTYKVTSRHPDKGQLIFSARIHAETMIASLKEVLNINYILLVDSGGKKVENCPCCAHYLCTQGFSNEPHMEAIQNYDTPTASQVRVCADWALSLQKEFSNPKFTLLPSAYLSAQLADEVVALGKKLLMQMFSLIPYNQPINDAPDLSQVFIGIKDNYPFELDDSKGLKNTYHLSRKLAHPENKSLTRTVVRKNRSSKRHLNYKLKLFDDGRFVESKSGNRVEPIDPDSPRSCELAKRMNVWLKKGDPSIQLQQEGITNIILLKR